MTLTRTFINHLTPFPFDVNVKIAQIDYENFHPAARRARVRQLNSDAMVAVLNETGMTLPAHTLREWRPTTRVTGYVNGITVGNVWCLATNGLLGLFTYWNGVAFLGHIKNFVWTEPVVTMFGVRASGAPAALYTGSTGSTLAQVRKGPKREKKKSRLTVLDELLATI